ncbi:hypothetical protein LI328DRAFT_10431 [Trichoderma asperelloides]|nr:hypothetical protein LI328DRAFT_10431 [Trichoderma asperelloides]
MKQLTWSLASVISFQLLFNLAHMSMSIYMCRQIPATSNCLKSCAHFFVIEVI